MMFWNLNHRKRKHIISKFADKVGLVYFGFVNQHSDDHKVVRGLTVSPSHQDNNYSVGTVSGYNVTIVDRSDEFNWLIMSFELHTKQPMPHFFIGPKNHNLESFSALFSTFPNMKDVKLGTFENYNEEFLNRFTLFARPGKSIEVERLLTAGITRTLGAHLWPLSVEQHNNVLYIYADNAHVTPHLLDSMLKNGLWLAAVLDSQSELV